MINRLPDTKTLHHDSDHILIRNVSAVLDTVIECPNCLSKLKRRIAGVSNTPAQIRDANLMQVMSEDKHKLFGSRLPEKSRKTNISG